MILGPHQSKMRKQKANQEFTGEHISTLTKKKWHYHLIFLQKEKEHVDILGKKETILTCFA